MTRKLQIKKKQFDVKICIWLFIIYAVYIYSLKIIKDRVTDNGSQVLTEL